MVFPRGLTSWMRVANVDFGALGPQGLAQNLTVRVAAIGGDAAAGTNASVVLTLDSPNGRPMAVCTVSQPSLGSTRDHAAAAPAWASVTCSITQGGASGIHDVYLAVSAVSQGAPGVMLAWWQVAGGRASGALPPRVVVQCDSVKAKANGLPLVVPATSTAPVTTGSQSGGSTLLMLEDNEDGSYGIGAPALGTYLCASSKGAPVTASASTPSAPCARFRLVGTTDGSYALFSLATAPAPLALAVDPSSGVLAPSVADPRNATGDAARFWLDCGSPIVPVVG